MIEILLNKYSFELHLDFFKKMSLTLFRAAHFSVDSTYILHANNATIDVAKFKSISLICNSVVLVEQKKLIPPIFYNHFLLYLLKIWALKNESDLSAFSIRHISAFFDQCDKWLNVHSSLRISILNLLSFKNKHWSS
jgi:hypothetical protein